VIAVELPSPAYFRNEIPSLEGFRNLFRKSPGSRSVAGSGVGGSRMNGRARPTAAKSFPAKTWEKILQRSPVSHPAADVGGRWPV